MDDFNKNPDWAVSGVKHRVMQDVYVDLSTNQMYRAKRKAREFILGDERLQYGKLKDYIEMIRVTDVGSRAVQGPVRINPLAAVDRTRPTAD